MDTQIMRKLMENRVQQFYYEHHFILYISFGRYLYSKYLSNFALSFKIF